MVSKQSPRIALVYDRVNKWGGAERVLLQLHQIFPDAPLFTLVHNPSTAGWSDDFNVIPSILNRIIFARSHHEFFAPIAPFAFESFDFSKFEIVISITSAEAKSIITPPEVLHLCYCLTPTRYLWSGLKTYSGKGLFSNLLNRTLRHFRHTDFLLSKRPDKFLAISGEVQKRIKKYYHQTSDLVYPGIDHSYFSDMINQERTGFLYVSRLVPYKNPLLVVKTFNQNKLPLTIVGTGREFNKLKRVANENIQFVGLVDDSTLKKYYQTSRALIFPVKEDFGLVPLEAQAAGCPVIALANGGALETVIHGETGLFFQKLSVKSINIALQKFSRIHFNSQKISQHARSFSNEGFRENFRAKVISEWVRHKTNNMS